MFQSEREPGNPFYQIYTLDLTTGDTKRISPGIGKTTCAFFRPGQRATSRSSSPRRTPIRSRSSSRTRSSPFARPGKERRYSWDYDPEMDIYAYNEKTGDDASG